MPWRTAIDNVAIVLSRQGRTQARAEARAGAMAWLDRVGLAEAAHVYPGALSGGMRQRVAIARALAARAPIVLVDEPFSNLDAATASVLRDDLTGYLRAERRAVVWVTHDAAEAAAVGNRTLTMHGPPDGHWAIGARPERPRTPIPTDRSS
ncbi:MAG TPA: ATP-binding cassette domain-containing protein [Ilumatobacteraceae bacterium]|nr:ATP-binding cassette domain-containing protein [Ilumatobacteraceae bacterium]